MIRASFQAGRGVDDEKVVERYFRGEAEAVPCKTLYEVVDLVRNGAADRGILPVENTITGCITHSYDLLLETRLNVTGEFILSTKHCFLALEDTPLKSLKVIYAHPSAVAQCEVFLRRFDDAEVVPVRNTVECIAKIKEHCSKESAIIATEEDAEEHDMKVMESGIDDYPNNQTRFMIVSSDEPTPSRRECRPYKTSVVFDTFNQPGALCSSLGIFERHEVNLTFLESRPHKTEPWKYHFFADLEGHKGTAGVAAALEELESKAEFTHVLGSYPRWVGEFSAAGAAGGEPDEGSPGPRTDIRAPLYSLRRRPEPTTVQVGEVVIGRETFTVMAGPCSVEGRRQLFETAGLVVESGAGVLRGGAFKPRTSPYSFQGMNEEGLKLLREAGREYGIPVITEVISVETLPLVEHYADIIQIGARNMQNFVLLTEAGRLNKPILLKRGHMATLKELLLSAEYILKRGNPHVILCERGIRTFETATRNTLDLSAVPYLKSQTHLPVVVDPSHSTGVSRLVPAMVKAAAAGGADGILVEVHFSPSTALCDGAQSLDGNEFGELMQELRRIVPVFGKQLT